MTVARLIFEVDLEKPLGPQLAVWRAHGMEWATIEKLTGISRRTLQPLVATSQIWERHCVRTEVLIPATETPGGNDHG